ncbi:MAG: efflux RND transporter periplasmic adaptor subunit [Pseudolabrys sp.]|nr:efflux RND transporter periplasmic adaptor subunit [Pseudolabrys sp.]
MNGRRISILAGIAVLAAVALYWHYGRTGAAPPQTAQRPAAAVPVTTTPVQVEDFAIRRRTIGILESPATVIVRSRIQSQVLEQHVKDGQLVRRGDLLFTLDDREVRAAIARDEAQIARDQATAERTASDLERYERLGKTDAVPRQQVDQAAADNKIALANVEAARAQLDANKLQLGYTRITAPIGGRVGAVRVTPGNLVSINDATGLLTITQIRPIRAAFTLAERDLGLLRKAFIGDAKTAVRVFTPGESTPLATGTLDFVDSAVDTASGTIAAKAVFPNTDFGLWPGMYVDVEIDLDVRPNTVMIPAVAIQSGQKGPFVFVVGKDRNAEMRDIVLIGIEGNRAAIASGAAAGERVIVEGQMRLVGGTRITEVAPSGSDGGGDLKQPAPPVAAGAAAEAR